MYQRSEMLRLRSHALAALVSASLVVSARAQVTWSGASSNDNFSSASNWVGGVVPVNNGSATLVFTPNGEQVMNLDVPVSIKELDVEGLGELGANITLTGANALTVTSNGIFISNDSGQASSLTLNTAVGLQANQTWAVESGIGVITANAGITGSSALTLNGSGSAAAFVFNSGASTYSGGTTLTGSTAEIIIGASSSGPTGPLGTGALALGDGTNLSTTVNTALTLANPLVLGDNSSGQPIVFGGGSTPYPTTSTILALSGGVMLNDAATNLGIAQDSTVTFSGNIAGFEPGVALNIGGSGGGGSLAILQGNISNVSSLNLGNAASVILDGSGVSQLGGSVTVTGQPNTYLGVGSGYSGSGALTAFLTYLGAHSSVSSFQGSLGLDTTSGPTATFVDPIDLTNYTYASFVGLGSATSAILGPTSVITPPGGLSSMNSTAYPFGGGGGMLTVQSALVDGQYYDGESFVDVPNSLNLSGGNAPLTLVLSGALSYSNGTYVDGAALIFDTPPPPGGHFSLGQGSTGTGYIGSTVNSGYSDANSNIQAFISLFGSDETSGVIGFDSLTGQRTVTSPIDLSSFGYGVYLGTATSVNYTGAITPSEGQYQFAGVKGGQVTVSSDLTGENSVVVGLPAPLESFNQAYGSVTNSSVTLAGNNSYTGNTTLNSGYLFVTNPNSLSSGTLTVSNSPTNTWSTLAVSGTAGGPVTLGNNIQIPGSGLALNTGGTNVLTITGVISDYSDYYGMLGIFGPVDLEGANTFSGPTFISGATVTIGNDTGLSGSTVQAVNSTLNFTSGNPVLGNATFESTVANFTAVAGGPLIENLSMEGSTLNFAANSTPLLLDMQSDQRGSGNAINLGSGAVLTFEIGDDPTYSGTINGPGSVVVSGFDGELVLNGNNTYTGGTTVGPDIVLIAGSNTAFGSTSAPVTLLDGGVLGVKAGVTVANPIAIPSDGAAIGGYGTIAPATAQSITFQNYSTVVGGRGTFTNNVGQVALSPVVGSLSFGPSASVVFGGAGVMQFSLKNAAGTPGVDYSDINVAGNLTIDATALDPFTIQLVGVDSTGLVTGTANTFNPTLPYSWTLVSAGSLTMLPFFDPSAFVVDSSTYFSNSTGTGEFFVSETGSDLTLNFSPVPEPSTWMLLASGLFALGAAVRRRR